MKARDTRIARRDPWWVRWGLITLALLLLGLLLLLPLAVVFSEAMAAGLEAFILAIREPDALAAIRLTLITALVSVSLNLIFGIAVWGGPSVHIAG